MERVEDSWAEEIAALRAEVIRQHGLSAKTRAGAEAVLALLQREFIRHHPPDGGSQLFLAFRIVDRRIGGHEYREVREVFAAFVVGYMTGLLAKINRRP